MTDNRKWLFSAFPPYKKIVNGREEEIDHLQDGWRENPFTEEEIKEAEARTKEPTPEPAPAPEPTPEPAPAPEPTPEPAPAPEPTPEPAPAPEPIADAVDKDSADLAGLPQASAAASVQADPVPTQEQAVKKTDWNKKLSKTEVKKASEELI